MLDLHIIPAIIPQSLEHLQATIERLNGVTEEIQIDIVDGVFVSDIESISDALPAEISYEFDLMITDPLQELPVVLAGKQHPKSVVLHIEIFATDADVMRAIEMVHAKKSNAIVASLNDTPLERLVVFVPHVDGIQCMGIAEIGRQGNPFDSRVLERVRIIREKYPALSISVDGSVNKETILSLKAAGANRFVVGSAIFNAEDPVRAYVELRTLIE